MLNEQKTIEMGKNVYLVRKLLARGYIIEVEPVLNFARKPLFKTKSFKAMQADGFYKCFSLSGYVKLSNLDTGIEDEFNAAQFTTLELAKVHADKMNAELPWDSIWKNCQP